MRFSRFLILFFTLFLLSGFTFAQSDDDLSEIQKTIEKDGCALTDEGQTKICKFDYEFGGKTVEALLFRPVADGKYPAVMLIPGYQGTPQRYINWGRTFVKSGFVAISVGTPGFGKTELEPDFLGKNTIDAYIAGFEKFKKEKLVDADKMGIFGYSRGAMATSLMLSRLKRQVKAAVLGGGVYDLKKAYDEVTIEGIKENIKKETGATEEGFKERSSIYKVKDIESPILIVHGAKDINVPVNQAYLLRDELKKQKKDFEIKIFEDKEHSIGPELRPVVIEYFSRKLKGAAAKAVVSK